jgi:hypothetical protein
LLHRQITVLSTAEADVLATTTTVIDSKEEKQGKRHWHDGAPRLANTEGRRC